MISIVVKVVVIVSVLLILLGAFLKGAEGAGIMAGGVVGTLIGLVLSYGIWSGIVWVVCTLLIKIGITSIHGWTVAFSWELAGLAMVIYWILQGIFQKKG